MNNKTKILAAIIMAFAMIVPLSIAMDNDAEPDEQMSITSLLDGSLFSEEITITGTIDDDMVIDDGEIATIEGDVIISPGVSITFKDGSQLNIDPMESFSIKAEAGAFVFEEGSEISVKGKTVTVPTDIEIAMTGKIASTLVYTYDGTLTALTANYNFVVEKNTTIIVNETETTFDDGLTFSANIAGNIDGGLATTLQAQSFADISASFTMEAVMNTGKVTVSIDDQDVIIETGTASITAKLSTPKANNTDNIKLTIKESGKSVISYMDQKIDCESSANLDIAASGLENVVSLLDPESLQDLVVSVTGDSSVKFSIDEMSYEDVFYIEGFSLNSNMSFDDKKFTEKSDFSIKEIKINAEKDNNFVLATLDNLKASEEATLDYGEFFKQYPLNQIIIIIGDFYKNADDTTDMDELRESIKPLLNDIDSLSDLRDNDLSEVTSIFDDIDWKKVIEALSLINVKEKCDFSLDSCTMSAKTDKAALAFEVKNVNFKELTDNENGLKISASGKVDNISMDVSNEEATVSTTISKVTITADYDGELEASITIDEITGALSNDEIAAKFNISDYETTCTMDEDYKATISAKANASLKTYKDDTLNTEITINKLNCEATADFSDLDTVKDTVEVKKFEANCILKTTGITIDCGLVSYDAQTKTVGTAKATFSGKLLSETNDLNTVEGSITGVEYSLEDKTFEFEASNITYVLKNGSTAVDVKKIDDGILEETITVTGEFPYNQINGYRNVVGSIMCMIIKDKDIVLTVDGNGLLYDDSLDDNIVSLTGQFGLNYELELDDYVVYIDFIGAYLVLNDGTDKLTIVAAEHYVLDPESYINFEVIDGYVVINEPEDDEEYVVISAESIGEAHVLTMDGKAIDVRYGDELDIPIEGGILWYADSKGTIYGNVIGGAWYYDYEFDGDLTINAVKGTAVDIKGGAAKSTSDSLYFEFPPDLDKVNIEIPSGLRFSVTSEDYYGGDVVKFSGEKTKYDGKDAYEITANGDSYVLFPISKETAVLYHVINGEPVEMVGEVVYDDNGNMFLGAHLTSYSVYYIDEGSGSGFNFLYVVAIVLIIIVILAIFFVYKKKNAGSA